MREIMQIRRLNTTSIRLNAANYKHILKCPVPTYDTGCTYCQPPSDLEDTHSPPESIRGTLPPMLKYVFFLSGNKDVKKWPKKFEFVPGSVMNELSKTKRGKGILTSYSSLSPTAENRNGAEFLVFPLGKRVFIEFSDEIEMEKSIQNFMLGIINGEIVGNEIKNLEKDTIFICGHYTRDIRCGIIGQMVFEEFGKVLEKEGLKDKVDVGLVSHVGGHKYAGHVIICKKNGDVLWYGMVRPEYVQGLVEKSIKSNEIVDELYRG